MNTITVRRKIENIKGLPTLPGVVQKISNMVENSTTSAEDIGRIISSDQVLTAKVLKLINSAFYGFPGRISSVTHGLVLIGFNVVKGLVLSASVFDMMEGKMVGLWEHSLGTAITSGIIAKRMNQKDPEEVSVAGLLHDIGKVVIKVSMPDKYEKILELVEEKEMPMLEAENKVLDFNHANVANWLCEKWNLPDNLKDPITYHHSPHLAKKVPRQTAMIHLADILVKGIGHGQSGDRWVPPLNKEAWQTLNLSKKDIEEIIIEMDTDLAMVEDFGFSS
ncbi:MAG TPA: HDOD domain-containing protein [Nitrospinota bacterium]|nr:HDOD domain-containing protein [Nitrospinota bacterium]